ncbi:MAG: UvrD-helicase domain-containing protein [Bacteroides sp.]|nr:UvrD-helicase domain-containing protein [Bacteroides sp.]
MTSTSPRLLVYKASAGSGKTFTLAVEYIKLLIEDPKAYQSILAVTFTNKATAEMKERILGQLYGIWKGDGQSVSYLNKLCEETGKDPGYIREMAGKALRHMIHDYSRFRVETIDSFFQTVMRNLARELDLAPNLNIELNNSEVLSEAVDSMIEKLERTSPVMVWLLDYIRERIAEDKHWNVSHSIKSFGQNIFDEEYQEKGEKLRESLRDPHFIPQYRKTLKELQTEALEQMKGFHEQFEGVLEENGLQPEELIRGKSGICSYFNKLRDGNLKDDIRNVTVEKCLADPKNWAAKSSPRFTKIVDLASSNLMMLLTEAETFRRRNSRIANTCKLSLAHLNELQLLANIDEEVRILNKENNRFLLSDTTNLLHSLVKEGDPSFVFEKIGATIRNVMIDEFQDTSRMQWSNFKLLLLEGLTQGADSLIVGDVKQSIYRWRNGDWKILAGLDKKIETFPIDTRNLKKNFRSQKNVIEFNNHFFTGAVHYLNDIHLQELGCDCTELKNAYADVSQESRHNHQAGYIKTTFLAPTQEEEYADITLNSLVEEVERLLAQGIQLKDITILVRKNRNIPPIAEHFDKHTPYRIVSDEAFRLDASVAVSMIIDVLYHLSEPDNEIIRSQLKTNYQKEVLKQQISLTELLLDTENNFLPEAFTTRFRELQFLPLQELIEEIYRLFDLSHIEGQDAYMFAFMDAVTQYLQNNPPDTDNFLLYWKDELCRKTIPGGDIEGIRIMSIHKSKGLEFHTVLLPFCDWKLENETYNQLVWCTPPEAPFNELHLVPVNYSSAMAQSLYQEDYKKERLQLWVDNLNLLYVAFTRAEKNLIVWSRKAQKNTVSTLLFNALGHVAGQIPCEWDGESLFESGHLLPSDPQGTDSATNRLTMPPEKRLIRMVSCALPASFRQSNRSADFIRGEEQENPTTGFIQRGKVLHTLFSHIRTTDDIDRAISKLLFEGIIDSLDTFNELKHITETAFRNPQIRHWFSGRYKIYNECSILYPSADSHRVRRPDRVMVNEDEVIVVDYKFGKADESYDQKIKEYMGLLSVMGYTNISGYLWYVYTNELIKIS